MGDSKKPLLTSTYGSSSDTAEQNRDDSDSHIIDIQCIYKVPRKLRKVNEEAYTPHLVSIGPFHYKNILLSSMESLKEVCFEEIFGQKIKDVDMSEIETLTGLKLVDIMSCYGTFEFPIFDEDFFLMILRDACFIIKLFQRNNQITYHSGGGGSGSGSGGGGSSSYRDHDHDHDQRLSSNICRTLKTPWLRKGIEQDLILLENQLPYFVLLKLYEKFEQSSSSTISFTKLALKFFSIESLCVKQETSVLHLTDLMRMFLLPIENPKSKAFGNVYHYPCSATKLDTAGIEFVLAEENTHLTQIETRTTKLQLYLPCIPSPKPLKFKIPEFKVKDETDCVLRNIMAFEQCHYLYDEPYVCSYVLLMHKLIKSSEDVDFLMEKKIIRHLVGGQDVVQLLGALSTHIGIPKSYYAVDCNRINKVYDYKWNSWMASFRRAYLKDVCTIGYTIVGVAVFTFSVTATIKSLFFS